MEREVLYSNHIWSFIKKGKTKRKKKFQFPSIVFFFSPNRNDSRKHISLRNGMRVNYLDISQTFFQEFSFHVTVVFFYRVEN